MEKMYITARDIMGGKFKILTRYGLTTLRPSTILSLMRLAGAKKRTVQGLVIWTLTPSELSNWNKKQK